MRGNVSFNTEHEPIIMIFRSFPEAIVIREIEARERLIEKARLMGCSLIVVGGFGSKPVVRNSEGIDVRHRGCARFTT